MMESRECPEPGSPVEGQQNHIDPGDSAFYASASRTEDSWHG